MKLNRKKLIPIVLILMVLSIAGIAVYYWYNNNHYISTEDASVTAEFIKISPQTSGKLLELNVKEGQVVEKDEIIGRQEMPALPDYNVDMSIVRAPIKGVVIKKQGIVGEVTGPGQVLAIIVNPDEIHINANIEETKIGKISPGQKVDITIDEYKNQKFTGKVDSIGEASSASFSLLPTSSGSNFTKVVQKIPVKIVLNNKDMKLLPGTSVVVKIHIR